MMAAVPAFWTDGAHAFVNGQLGGNDRSRLMQQGRWSELQLLENRQRRLQFQSQQQQYREQERGVVADRLPPIEVPTMRRNCQTQPFGSNWLTSCR